MRRSADGACAPRGFRFVAKDLRRSERDYGSKRLQEAERERDPTLNNSMAPRSAVPFAASRLGDEDRRSRRRQIRRALVREKWSSTATHGSTSNSFDSNRPSAGALTALRIR